MTRTKKSLLASGLALLICAALLVGTTFAWFTDSVTNKGNSIQAGSLMINAYAYKLGTGGQTCTIPGFNGNQKFTFTDAAQDLRADTTPIINEPMWEPGASSAKLLQVTNNGTLAAKLKLDFTTSGDLTNALWFDFIQIDENGDKVGTFTQRPMNTLATFAENLELPLDAGATVRFVLVYGMYTTVGSEYMGDSFTADVTILATQNTKEADGFGNTDYDQDAEYPIVTVDATDDLADVITNAPTGSIVDIKEEVSLPTGQQIIIGDQKEITIQLNQNTLCIEGENFNPIVVSEGSTLTVTDGTVTTDTATYCFENNGNLLLDNVTVNTPQHFAIHNYATLTVQNSHITAAEYAIYNYNATVESIQNSSIEVSGSGAYALYNLGSCTIREIKNSSICAYTTGMFSSVSVYNSAASTIERIVGCTFDGKINNQGTICIQSGSFQNSGLTLEAFQKLIAEGCTATESNGIFTVS